MLISIKISTISAFSGPQISPDVINLFACSTQLSMKFKILISRKISTNSVFSWAQISLKCYIFPAHTCQNANNCYHFNIYEQEKFHAKLSVEHDFYNLGPWSKKKD